MFLKARNEAEWTSTLLVSNFLNPKKIGEARLQDLVLGCCVLAWLFVL